jgi:membrane associated rhomboid family serine protease
MGKIEALQKRIDQIADRVKHLRYILIALMSGIVGVVFGISQATIKNNLIVDVLLIFGTISVIVLGFMIRKEEKKRDLYIKQLEVIKD